MTTSPPFIYSVYILVKVASSSGPSSNLFCTQLPVKVYKYTPPRMSDKKWRRTQQQQQPNKCCATHLSTMQQHLNWPFVLGPDLPAAPSPVSCLGLSQFSPRTNKMLEQSRAEITKQEKSSRNTQCPPPPRDDGATPHGNTKEIKAQKLLAILVFVLNESRTLGDVVRR